MSGRRPHSTAWRGASLIAITYVYFLIFAQFAFLHRLAAFDVAGADLKIVMAAMAAGGILFSLLTPRLTWLASPQLRLRVGLAASGVAALFTLLSLNAVSGVAEAFLIGAGLAVLTVTLATHLRSWCGESNPLFIVGLGTGVGYFLCNLPALFDATPQAQAFTAAALCIAGILIAPRDSADEPEPQRDSARITLPFVFVLACFAALVWLDSAAFFIIQSTEALKAGTWQGTAHLWANGLLHFVAALASAVFLRRRGVSFVLSAAFLALACACLLLLDPSRALPASVFYPIGVSLYSVALVAYPSILAPAATPAARGRQAGWIYAVAGWIGSALGIGMGQNLGHIPPAFVAAAGTVILLPSCLRAVRTRARELALTAALLLIAFLFYRGIPSTFAAASSNPVERGRQVYISEGCISCHSQYVRPNSPDVLMWGPVESLAELHAQRPPLIGNRRQGPDLTQVGTRRSPFWLKIHFFNPAAVSGASIMPSYGFLFRDERGDDLVAYLESLHSPDAPAHIEQQQGWHLAAADIDQANFNDGQRLYNEFCATCHNANGRTLAAWKAGFKNPPTDLLMTPLAQVPIDTSPAMRIDRIAHITKFGMFGTDMPGHEYLSDNNIASLSLWLAQTTARPAILSDHFPPSGEKP